MTRALRTMAALISLAACIPTAFGAVFDVSNPAEFQAALTAAEDNFQDDVINVGECSGTGCSVFMGFDVYDITSTLTYTAAATENNGLTIDGFDSNTRILDGGFGNPILRIDTQGATDDFGAAINVRNMTLVRGNAMASPDDGGALAILTNSALIEVTGSVFEANQADDDGGALYIRAEGISETPILLDDLTFDTNEALGISSGGGGGNGGAAYVSAGSFVGVVVRNIDFFDSTAAGKGGCLVVEGLDPTDPPFQRVTSVNLQDLLFDGCTAGTDGGGAFIAAGGTDVSVAGFVRSEAGAGNSGSGGGLFVADGWTSLGIVNSGFAGNMAADDGGGLYTGTNMGFATVINNTLYQNTATSGDGGNAYLTIGGSTGEVRVWNNILYNGTAGGVANDIYINNDPFNDIPATVQFIANDINVIPAGPGFNNASFFIASTPELTSSDNIAAAPGLSNILNADPDPSQDPNSPTIDAGRSDLTGVPNVDFENDLRPLDGDNDMVAVHDIGMDEAAPGGLPSADIGVIVTDTPDPVTEFESLTYAVTVDNAGPDNADDVQLQVTLPPTVPLVSATPGQGTCNSTAGDPVTVTCLLGSIASSGNATATIVVTAPDVVMNTNMSSEFNVINTSADDPDIGNNLFNAVTTVLPAGPAQADLAVTKNGSPNPVFSRGPELTYLVTVQNNGPSTASGVTLTDTLPVDDVTFVSASATNGGSCGDPDMAGVIGCSLGSLALNENATVTIVVMPNEVTSPITIDNTASVTATEEDPIPANNTSTVQTTVNPPSADLSVMISAVPESPSINEQVTYTVTVTSAGPSDSEAVVLSITLPAQGTVESVGISKGSCTVTEGVAACAIGALDADETVTAEVLVTAPDVATTLILEATVLGDADDPNGSNDSVADAVSVIDTVNLVIRGKGGKSSAFGWPELVLGATLLVLLRLRVRRGRRLRASGSAAAAVLLAATVCLPWSGTQAAERWYVGGALGQADANYKNGDLVSDLAARGWTISNASVSDRDTAWKLYGGFNLNEYLGLEIGYASLGQVRTRYEATIPPNRIDDILNDTFDVHPFLGAGWTFGGVARLPLGDGKFDVHARAGAYVWEADIEVEVVSGGSGRVAGSEDGTGGYYGVGAEWRVTPRFSLTVDWERYRLNEWVDVPSLGVRVMF